MHPQDFIQQEIPPVLQTLIPRACISAYRAVDEVFKASSFLSVPSAAFGKGHLVAWAVDFAMENLIRSGKWPFDHKWEYFDQPTGKYLKIFTPEAVVTINQLPDPITTPRSANFRSNHRFNNQYFLDLPQFKNEIVDEDRPHLIIAHGYQELSFAQICVPHPDADCNYWLYRTPNLMRGLQEISEDFPASEESGEVVVTLKEKIAEKFGTSQ